MGAKTTKDEFYDFIVSVYDFLKDEKQFLKKDNEGEYSILQSKVNYLYSEVLKVYYPYDTIVEGLGHFDFNIVRESIIKFNKNVSRTMSVQGLFVELQLMLNMVLVPNKEMFMMVLRYVAQLFYDENVKNKQKSLDKTIVVILQKYYPKENQRYSDLLEDYDLSDVTKYLMMLAYYLFKKESQEEIVRKWMDYGRSCIFEDVKVFLRNQETK